MTAEESIFERYAREIAEARQAAAIRELDRRIKVGEFPDNDDTIKAFAAGWYSAYAYRAELKAHGDTGGSNSRMGSMMLLIIGLLVLFTYISGLSLTHGISPMRPAAHVVGIVGILMLVGSYLLGKRSARQDKEADDAFRAKWSKEKTHD